MQLTRLLEAIGPIKIYGTTKKEIKGISEDSRKVKRGYLFVAIKGGRLDGHDFIKDAIEKGSSAIVGERPRSDTLIPKGVTYVKVDDSRKSLGFLASCFYDYPSKKLKIIGVTGTDGKTTTASLIYHLLTYSGKKVGLISTVGAKIGKDEVDTGLHVTSPDAVSLQKFLSQMVRAGCEYAVVEVTSHGLDQERFSGVEFDCAVLTNITHEHLDYHKTWESYRDSKAKLFQDVKAGAIINKDDPSYDYISSAVPPQKQIVSFGIENKDSTIYAQNVHEEDEKTSFEVIDGVHGYVLETNLPGDYNISNILASIGCVRIYGVDEKSIRRGVAKFSSPEGRMEKVECGQDFGVYVDFAHTPNSLEKVLTYLKKRLEEKGKGRLIVVFGCAGERDVKKRPMMGEISARLADASVFTAEDPRSEDVEEIINGIVKGAKRKGAKEFKYKNFGNSEFEADTQSVIRKEHVFVRIPERGEAISFALQRLAQGEDSVIICGKGHERSMAYDSVEHPWSDREMVENALLADRNKVAVVLAAGLGKRMGSTLPKVIHKIAGRSIISLIIENLRKARFGKIVVVVGYKKELVMRALGSAVEYAIQKNQLGTADALVAALKHIPDKVDSFLVVNGDDSAFYEPSTLNEVLKSHKAHKADLTLVTLVVDDPTGLGRIVREDGKIKRIVEEKDTDERIRKIKEVNINFFVFNTKWVKQNIKKVKKSMSGEYYIVDLVGLAISQKKKVNVYRLKNKNEWVGINTPEQLKIADKMMRDKRNILLAQLARTLPAS